MSTSDEISSWVRIAGNEVELSSLGPLMCKAVVVLFVTAAAELPECNAVVTVILLVAAEVGGEWLSLDNVVATCCMIVAISSGMSPLRRSFDQLQLVSQGCQVGCVGCMAVWK